MYNPRIKGGSQEYGTVKVLSHGAIAKNDFVTLKTDGQAEPTAAGEGIFGIALESAAGASEVITVARVYPGMRVLMDNDNVGTTFAASHVGGRFDTTGATGAQLVDTSTVAQDGTDSGQLLCIEYNPKGFGLDKDTSIGLYEISEVQGSTNATA